jgi:hypothetical protein
MRRNLLAAVSAAASVGLLTLTYTSLAYRSVLPVAAATLADEHPTPLPQITVRARRELEHRVQHFVSNVTGSLVSDDAVQLWRTPVCLAVTGLRRSDGERLFVDMERSLMTLGAPLGKIGCRPNFLIIATAEPETFLHAMATRWPGVFGYGSGLQSFINTARPVRIWYNADLIDQYGVPANAMGWVTSATPSGSDSGGTTMGGAPGSADGGVPVLGYQTPATMAPRAEYAALRPLVSVIAVVDLKRAVDLDIRQIADYVAMVGLTRVNLDADFGEVPTVLRLFRTTGKDRPVGLTDWDKALLKELYKTDPYSRSQRIEVSRYMVHDILPTMTQSTDGY